MSNVCWFQLPKWGICCIFVIHVSKCRVFGVFGLLVGKKEVNSEILLSIFLVVFNI